MHSKSLLSTEGFYLTHENYSCPRVWHLAKHLTMEEDGYQISFSDRHRKDVSCNIHPGVVAESSWELLFPVF